MSKRYERAITLPTLLGLGLIVLLVGTASAAIWTDQGDYSPGSMVTISGDNSDGAGYLAGETVMVEVQGPNGYTAACGVVADDQGAWSCQVTLWPDELAVGNYDYVATGQTSGVSQSAYFADSAGYYHYCWLKDSGTVWCAGRNEYGQLGVDPNQLDKSDLPLFVGTLGDNVVQISGGFGYNCALKANGSVWCWGFNDYGQLGIGTQSSTHEPMFVSTLGYNVAQLSAGHWHACALKLDGSTWCWGRNNYGQLGIGAQGNSNIPVQVSSLGYDGTQISAGYQHTCALKAAGSAWCWGQNNYGQLGIGSYNDSNIPVLVSALGSNVTQIDSGGFAHTCARRLDGSAWCWGHNHVGQLGNGASTPDYAPGVNTPVAVAALGNDVVRVDIGVSHSCGLMTNGGVQCWGYNFDGQLGRGYFQPWSPWPPGQPTPNYVLDLDSGVAQISSGDGGTCALMVDGSVKCWGIDNFDRFGLGQLEPWRFHTPMNVLSLGNETIALPDNIVNPPTADPNGPYLGPTGSEIFFYGNESVDPDGGPLIYDWDWGDGTISLNAGPTPSHTFTSIEIYDVCLTVSDIEGLTGTACTLAVVYDPEGGFVTGGGWIDSPAGAYKADPLVTGKASFGFASKYHKELEPSGNTEFQFKMADFNFHSKIYEWLLVTGSNHAKFKGVGTINGEGEYHFMLWAGDSDPDTFHIKIWDEDDSGNEIVIYDNDGDQPVADGSIVVHTQE